MKKLINSKSNCGTTLQKFFSPEKEEVYKLNLQSNYQNQILNSLCKIPKESSFNIINKKNYSGALEMNELVNSVEKIKKFFPNVSKLINYKINHKIEDKLFKRYEHQELENILKGKMKNNNLKKEKIKKELYILRNELKIIEDEKSDALLDLNIFKDVNKYINFKSEENKFRRNSKKLYTLKLDNKIFEKNELNNSINSRENTPKNNKYNENNQIFNFNNDDNNNTNNIKTYSNDYKSSKSSSINNIKIISYIHKNKNAKMINLSNKIVSLKNKKIELFKKIKVLEEEKKIINLENEEIKNNLYNHFLELLKEGDDTRNEGLSWIIKEIFYLGKNVLISYLPKFLDEQGIAFLFKQAKIFEKIDNYEQKIINLKKELVNLGVINNLEKVEDIWKKVEGTEFLGNEFIKTNLNNITPNDAKIYLKEKYLFKSIRNKKFKYDNVNINNITSINNISNDNTNTNIKENSFNKVNIKKILISPNKKIKKIKLSRNDFNGSNEQKKKIFSFSSRKSYILNINLKEVQKYRHKLTIGEIQKLLKETKIKINHNCIKKIREYMKLNSEKKLMKQLLNEMKNNEIQRIFDEYTKRSYYQRYMVEKNVVLSALIGEDSLFELNKQLKNGKFYFNNKFQ